MNDFGNKIVLTIGLILFETCRKLVIFMSAFYDED